MASRQLGPWKLLVKDRAAVSFERFIAFDGKELAWVWRSLGETRGNFAQWEALKAPWLPAVVGPRMGGEPVLLTACFSGVSLGDLLDGAAGEALPVGASCALALAVARGLEQLLENAGPEDVPLLAPDSILIGFDGGVSLMPWPEIWPASSATTFPGEYRAPQFGQSPGWRVYVPSLVLTHALDRVARSDGTRLSHRAPLASRAMWRVTLERLPPAMKQLVDRALDTDPSRRPALEELIAALTPLASNAELAEVVTRHFAHEPKEQQYDRTLAQGKDPEPLPPELVRALAREATDEGFGVLADWLLAEGHPRGELAALQLKLEQGASNELARAEATLVARHRSLLPVALRERLQQWRPLWKAGWLVGLELKAVPEAETLTEILSHPTLRFLRRIRVRPDGGGSKVLCEVLASLELPALRQVELDGGVATFAPKLKKARPRLTVESNKARPAFPARRRPEASVSHARVGVGDREPAPGLPPLMRLMDWLSGDD